LEPDPISVAVDMNRQSKKFALPATSPPKTPNPAHKRKNSAWGLIEGINEKGMSRNGNNQV